MRYILKLKNKNLRLIDGKQVLILKDINLLKSFEKQYEVIGMKREEIETLLGNPNKTETKKGTKEIEAYEYRIEDNLIAGWKVYRINFKKDIVTKVEILTEDW